MSYDILDTRLVVDQVEYTAYFTSKLLLFHLQHPLMVNKDTVSMRSHFLPGLPPVPTASMRSGGEFTHSIGYVDILVSAEL
jgi:hypothetical protein